VFIFIFVADATEVKPIVVKPVELKAIGDVTGKHKNDIGKKKKESKNVVSWKRIADGECMLKMKKASKTKKQQMRKKIVMIIYRLYILNRVLSQIIIKFQLKGKGWGKKDIAICVVLRE
jgi:hypothetical protein